MPSASRLSLASSLATILATSSTAAECAIFLAASTETVPPHQAPVAVSFVTLFYATGQFLGPALAGLVVEWSEGFRVAFAGSCLVMVGGVYLCWRTRRHQGYRSVSASACAAGE